MSFEKAAAAIKASSTSGEKMSNDELSKIYGLYKQGSSGDNTTAQPGSKEGTDKEKWNAWNSYKGKSKEDAQKEYVEYARTLLKKYNQPADF